MVGQEDRHIDVGGQDTKYILVQDGRPFMNDKCCWNGQVYRSYANRLGLTIEESYSMRLNVRENWMYRLARYARLLAESEVINYMGEGRPKKKDCSWCNRQCSN